MEGRNSGTSLWAAGSARRPRFFALGFLLALAATTDAAAYTVPPTYLLARTEYGVVLGVEDSGVRIFRGIPFAAPPVGPLRWKEPQPPASWSHVRITSHFESRCMQRPIFQDMRFRSDAIREDCLYLNVWTPVEVPKAGLPVLVYFYGGGFVAGDGSELRYDGESMARQGIVSITVNYRLGAFGFLAHPALAAESARHASGNYGLLDQVAALRWVRENVAAFGGDPRRITIAGESAGSFSVSALMASPLSRDLIAGAIGESGSLLGGRVVARSVGEEDGVKFQALLQVQGLAQLRALPAEKILEASAGHEWELFHPVVDGYFFPKEPGEIYRAGEQAHVPLLVGWNTEESDYHGILGDQAPTRENLAAVIRKESGARADEALALYRVDSDEQVKQVAGELATDVFMGLGTWKWADLHAQTGGSAVYRYLYARPRPGAPGGNDPPARGAVHSSEIEYALGNLPLNRDHAWTPDDYLVSKTLQAYFANFIRTGQPGGDGLPAWPKVQPGEPAMVMRIDVQSEAHPEAHRDRYLFLDSLHH